MIMTNFLVMSSLIGWSYLIHVQNSRLICCVMLTTCKKVDAFPFYNAFFVKKLQYIWWRVIGNVLNKFPFKYLVIVTMLKPKKSQQNFDAGFRPCMY